MSYVDFFDRFAHVSRRAKINAQRKLARAVKSGRIVKPSACEFCGVVPKTAQQLHGHHEDYDTPLSVEWLCGTCHMKRHWNPDAARKA